MKNIKSSINVIKSGVGNIGSIVRVLEDLDYEYKIVNKPQDFSDTKKIILPGVGSYDSFINSLIQNKLLEEIKYLVLKEKYSILGICVGMQSFFLNSEEGSSKGFGFIDDKCKKVISNYCHINYDKDENCKCWDPKYKNDKACIEYKRFFENPNDYCNIASYKIEEHPDIKKYVKKDNIPCWGCNLSK